MASFSGSPQGLSRSELPSLPLLEVGTPLVSLEPSLVNFPHDSTASPGQGCQCDGRLLPGQSAAPGTGRTAGLGFLLLWVLPSLQLLRRLLCWLFLLSL